MKRCDLVARLAVQSGLRPARRQGFTMLLTVMVLMLLTTVVVTFQLDMLLRMRASRYREAKVQCQYAAESGLVVAFSMVDQALEAQRKGDFKAIASIMSGNDRKDGQEKDKTADDETGAEDPNSPADPNSPEDPNAVEDGEKTDEAPADPIAGLEDWLDPNRLAEMLESGDILESVPIDNPLVISKRILEVGQATVEIEVFDENAKLPLHWDIDSPYLSGTAKDKDVVGGLGRILQVDGEVTDAARELIRTFGRDTPVKGVRKVIQQRKGASTNYRNPTGQAGQVSDQPLVWEQQRLRLAYSKAREMEFQQREMMAGMTARVNFEIAENEELADFLNVPVGGQGGTFLDYVGTWGHDKINLNTAPAEVLEAAFGIMGFDRGMAQAIVSRREQKPFASTYELRQTPGIDEAVVGGLVTLTTVRSDTFSIQIKATQGACENRLTAGIYRDRLGRLQTIAVFKPKGF